MGKENRQTSEYYKLFYQVSDPAVMLTSHITLSSTSRRVPTVTTLTHIALTFLARAIKQDKGIKCIQIRKVRLSLQRI